MMNVEKLRQSENNLVAVGTLKTNGLTEEVDKSGRNVVRGNIVLEIKDGDTINEVEINCYSAEGSKPYNNIKQAVDLLDKAKALDPSMAARVRVIGGIELNEYVSRQDNDIVSFNRNNAAYIFPGTTAVDDIKVELEAVIKSKTEKDGSLYLNVLYADYKGTIEEIKGGIRVPESFRDQVDNLYNEGDTAKIAFTINNSVTTKGGDDDTVAFGQVIEDVRTETEYVLTGGYPPLADGERYSDEEVAKMIELREQQYQQLEASIVPKTDGFGAAGGAEAGGFNDFSGSESGNPFL